MLPRLLPGDPVTALAGEQVVYDMTPEMHQQLLEEFQLDKPITIQLVGYLKSIVQFDFGYSYFYKKKVIDLICLHLPWTLALVVTSMLISIGIGYVTGIESSYHHGKRMDKILLSTMMFISGFPQFFLGMLLLLFFSIYLGWLPMGGCETPCSTFTGLTRVKDIMVHMVLPVVTLVISEVSNMYLLTRSTAISISKRTFMGTAVAKGLKDRLIKHRYLGKNCFITLLTLSAIMMGRLFVGVLLIEVVFAYPGLGSLIFEAVKARDYPVLQGVFLIVAFMVLLMNGLAESIQFTYSRKQF